ncbi:MAG: hypothetical protein FJY97_12690 [candidate division Zixibacteria bacterium]|nr:hypothetical protein [candidate division Zixibacteria bacterium]
MRKSVLYTDMGGMGGHGRMYLRGCLFLPVIYAVFSIWEVEEGIQRAAVEVRERIEQYMPAIHHRIGEIMVSQGFITQNQLEEALEAQQEGERLGETMVRLGFVGRTQRDESVDIQTGKTT